MSDPGKTRAKVWCETQRAQVIDYLKREGLIHGDVGDQPAWHIWPYVAIWAIESVQNPGWVGWWAVSGDLPTDYVTCGPQRHPREGLRDIAKRWKEAASCSAENNLVSGWNIGTSDDWPSLAPLLEARANLLLTYAADDARWDS